MTCHGNGGDVPYRNVYKDKDQLELVAQNEEEVENWKASLLRAGVYPQAASSEQKDVSRQPSGKSHYKHTSFLQKDDLDSIDPQLERQVETIRNLVDSYLSIVSKNVRDVVPKTIMYMMVNQVRGDHTHCRTTCHVI